MNDEGYREDVLAAMRLALESGIPLSTANRLQLQHANAQCLRTLKGIAEEGGE